MTVKLESVKMQKTLDLFVYQITESRGSLFNRSVLAIKNHNNHQYLEMVTVSFIEIILHQIGSLFGWKLYSNLSEIKSFMEQNSEQLKSFNHYSETICILNKKIDKHNAGLINQLFNHKIGRILNPQQLGNNLRTSESNSQTLGLYPEPHTPKSLPSHLPSNPVTVGNSISQPVTTPKVAGVYINGSLVLENSFSSLKRKFQSIGQLGARWTMNSDHLPVGARIVLEKGSDKQTTICVGTFNALNSKYVRGMLTPANGGFKTGGGLQGLDGSAITVNHPLVVKKKIEGSDQTRDVNARDDFVIGYILEMIAPQEVSRDVLYVCECSRNMIDELRISLAERFPPNSKYDFKILDCEDRSKEDNQIFIYNAAKLTVSSSEMVKYVKSDTSKAKCKTIYCVDFVMNSDFKKKISVIGTHVPGGPDNTKAREELVGCLLTKYNPTSADGHPTILMGDMNTRTHEIYEALSNGYAAYKGTHAKQLFMPLTTGRATHIDNNQEPSDYDSIFMASGNCVVGVEEDQMRDVLYNQDADDMARLLGDCEIIPVT